MVSDLYLTGADGFCSELNFKIFMVVHAFVCNFLSWPWSLSLEISSNKVSEALHARRGKIKTTVGPVYLHAY